MDQKQSSNKAVGTGLPPRKAIPSFWNRMEDNNVFLHLGENPYAPTNAVRKAIEDAARHANRYPDTNCGMLREVIAEYVGYSVKPENVIVGNGSDELIDLAVVSFIRQGQCAAVFNPTFFVYSFAAKRHGRPTLSLSQTKDFEIPDISTIHEDEWQNTALMFIANPNNPTGTLTARERLLEWIGKAPGIVVIDECYFEYSGATLVDSIFEYDNLIVFRSLSKSFGLSGLRLGYAVANEQLIDTMARYALTFPVNVIAQAAGIAAIGDLPAYQERIDELKRSRDAMRGELIQLGFEIPESHTNFILAFPPVSMQKINLSQTLAEQGILVSDQSSAPGIERPAIRIAVGTPEENQRLIACLKETAHRTSVNA